MGLQIGIDTMENRFLKKLKIELFYNPKIPFLGIYLNKAKTLMIIDIHITVFSAVLFTIAQIWKQPKCPSIATQLDKQNGTSTP